jgi:sigma-E factor negative regulatory protein RseC
MEDEIGVVTEVEGVTAKVVVQKRGTCDSCAAEGTCESTEAGMEIEAVNLANAKVGQTVKVSIKPLAYLKESILVYGMPLVFFLAGAIAGKMIGPKHFPGINSDLLAAFAGFAALALSFAGVKLWSRKAEARAEYRPFIEEIVK